jgi:glycosyltransferase involved in cell wall biosynthesis
VKITLFHNRYKQRGGEDTTFDQECALLASRGNTVLPIVVTNEAIKAGIGTALRATWSQESYRTALEHLKVFRPDVLHVHNFFPRLSPAIYYAASSLGIPVVQTIQNYRLLCLNGKLHRSGRSCNLCVGSPIPWQGVRYSCYRGSMGGSAAIATMLATHRALRTWQTRVTRYIALTRFARELLIRGGLPADRIVIKPNCLSLDPGIGTGEGGFALFVGRLVETKGVITLLKAWEGVDFPLVIAGDGPLRQALQTSQPNVTWVGEIPHSETIRMMQRARFLVFPSEWLEGFPLVLAEALAVGLPVLAARIGAAAEIVLPGKSGLHFEPGDPESLRNGARQLLADDVLRGDLSRGARARYLSEYTPDRNYERLMLIYNDAIRQQRA